MKRKDLKNIRFGIEIEFTGVSKIRALTILKDYWDAPYISSGKKQHVIDKKERKWIIVKDESIDPEMNIERINSRIKLSEVDVLIDSLVDMKLELVSPICSVEDIVDIQEIVRLLRKEGAVVNETCGIHVHIGIEDFTPYQIRNLYCLVYNYERNLYRLLNVSRNREEKYCKRADINVYSKMRQLKKGCTNKELIKSWYNNDVIPNERYHKTRYHGLNLHSYFRQGTAEFRFFNSSLHAGIIKTYIQVCIALALKAKTHNDCTNIKRKYIGNPEVYWFKYMGLDTDEFKTTRIHLVRGFQCQDYFMN